MTEERKQSLFLEYIDGTLDAEGMEELHALTEEDPSAKEELFSLKELADAAMKGDEMSRLPHWCMVRANPKLRTMKSLFLTDS